MLGGRPRTDKYSSIAGKSLNCLANQTGRGYDVEYYQSLRTKLWHDAECPAVVKEHKYTSCSVLLIIFGYIRGGSDMFLERPGKKQVKAIKLEIYAT